MSKIVRLLEYRRGADFVHFTRSEMNQLLSLYSRRVMRGEWRDYAIDQQHDGAARFAVFRSTLERPQYIITKRLKGGGRPGGLTEPSYQFTVLSGRETVAMAASLLEVLRVFDQPVRLQRGSP
jgi:hypothetical protein